MTLICSIWRQVIRLRSRNHPFVDGNKRAAFVVAAVFLLDNGGALSAGDAEIVEVTEAVASGALSEQRLAAWFRARSAPQK